MALSIEAIIGAVAVFVSLPPSLVIVWNHIKQKNYKESRRRGINPPFHRVTLDILCSSC